MTLLLQLKILLFLYLETLVLERRQRLGNDLFFFPETYGMNKFNFFKTVVYILFFGILAYHAFFQ